MFVHLLYPALYRSRLLALLGTVVTISWKSLLAEASRPPKQNKTILPAQLHITTLKQALTVLLLHFYLFI